MNTEQIVSVIVAILSGLATCIPLAIKLVQYVKKAAQEKHCPVIAPHLLGGFTLATQIVGAGTADFVRLIGQTDEGILLQHGLFLRHVFHKSPAVALSLEEMETKTVMGAQGNDCFVHSVTAAGWRRPDACGLPARGRF